MSLFWTTWLLLIGPRVGLTSKGAVGKTSNLPSYHPPLHCPCLSNSCLSPQVQSIPECTAMALLHYSGTDVEPAKASGLFKGMGAGPKSPRYWYWTRRGGTARAIIPQQSTWQSGWYLENDLNVVHGRNDWSMSYGIKKLLLTLHYLGSHCQYIHNTDGWTSRF